MVLSEPFGRLDARTTYGKVPPRKRPALGRRHRPEQDFGSGLRRRDDRRTGTPDPCSAALYGSVLKASSSSKTIPRNRRRTAMNISEPKIVIGHREHLWILLSEARSCSRLVPRSRLCRSARPIPAAPPALLSRCTTYLAT